VAARKHKEMLHAELKTHHNEAEDWLKMFASASLRDFDGGKSRQCDEGSQDVECSSAPPKIWKD
jgi:hypothetical protein